MAQADQLRKETRTSGKAERLPSRLHHTAYVTKDMEATRKFYEEVIGLPLIATWSESDELFGKTRTYCHCFFGLGDGGALAFFQFENPEDQAEFGPKMPFSPFHHIALNVDAQTQKDIEERIKLAGYKAPQTFVLEHGYCRSVYVTDPNGMILEFTLDAPNATEINQVRREKAHDDLWRWLKGDHTSNNVYR
jgi:glyoxylase I family protein